MTEESAKEQIDRVSRKLAAKPPCPACGHVQAGYPEGYCESVVTEGGPYDSFEESVLHSRLCGCEHVSHGGAVE